ncbi:hypothetical protein CORC01_01325 [Colletotrichum orchidophilum]|uniref:Uncharacterized protein n=1 Tax=Colletotrichum orchidophilum TaxID=1209926 RepID=A0A1G4BP85_9PEZI|nr:uncharacterized protein CORC01_01325 [Colletotrichum orchidophilum]OHF03272.1 hypothetical protein CORC01_01325 [Colletotrichum orchidophilum]
MIRSPQWRENLDIRCQLERKNPSERRPTPCPCPETPWSDRACGAVTVCRSIITSLAVCKLVRICSPGSETNGASEIRWPAKTRSFYQLPMGKNKEEPWREARGRWAVNEGWGKESRPSPNSAETRGFEAMEQARKGDAPVLTGRCRDFGHG